VLVGIAPALRLVGLLADERLVYFDDLAQPAKGRQPARAHRLTDAMGKKPRGLVGDLQHAVQLVGGNALLAARQQVDRLQHLVQRDMRGLENRSNLHGERLPALATLLQPKPGRLALQFVDAFGVSIAAVGANRTIRPKHAFQIRESGGFIVKVGLGQNGHRLASNPETSLAVLLGYVKYIIAFRKAVLCRAPRVS